MKRFALWFSVVLSAAAPACGGPSALQVKEAKTARYGGNRLELYVIAKQVAAQTYKIGYEDPASFRFATRPQWYTAEGGRQSAGAGNFVQIGDRSVQLSLQVDIEELLDRDQNEWAVVITPITLQYIDGSPKPRELVPDDPNLPPWIPGRVDALAIDIHNAAKARQIQ